DPVAGLVIALIIGYWGIGLLRASSRILLQGVPPHVEIAEVSRAIKELEAVSDVYDVHVWELTSHRYVMTGHVYLKKDLHLSEANAIGEKIQDLLRKRFAIGHATLQFEIKR